MFDRPIHVLCVDDDPAAVELTAALVEREAAVTTSTATSAAAGLERLAVESVDCVVSAYRMADTDGLAFLAQVRAAHGDLPFVLFTGTGSEATASEAISQGVTDYVRKRPDTDGDAVLARRVEAAVERQRAATRVEATLDPAKLVGEPVATLAPGSDRDDPAPDTGPGVSREGEGTSESDESEGEDDGFAGRRRGTTERTERHEELELAETLFENAQDALFVIDVDEDGDEFRLERVNPAYEAHTGLANEELRGRRLGDVFGDEEGNAIVANYRRCLELGEPIQYEERLSVPAARTDWETRIAPVVVDGRVERLVGATRDVTERRERERRYDAIFNQTYQFTGLMEPDGTLLEANETALEFGGLDRGDVIGDPIWEAGWWQIDETTRERLRDAVGRAAAGEFVRYDVTVQGAEGTAAIDFSIRPITDERGEVVLLVPEGRDITELKTRERELRGNREFLAQVQEVAEVGGWEVDLRSGTMRWTDVVYRIHGLSREYEPTVEAGLDFYHPDDRATIEAALDRLTEVGEPYDLELRLVASDGELRWVRTRGKPWYDDGEVAGARGTIQDVTARKGRERELERQNERLDEFASVASHDLRNPLMVAHGSLELARVSGRPEDFDRVEAAHARMDALIDDLLTLAREGRRVEETRPVALAAVVESAWESVPGADATLTVDCDGYRVDADGARLRQLLENLLSNAVTHGGDDVAIRVAGLDDAEGFYVADDGPGIPTAEREGVFEKGYSTTGEGTGFGLAIVAEIAEAHGWTVAATDGADGGARFEVTVGLAE
jgi:PAS domain S-box-containing protein